MNFKQWLNEVAEIIHQSPDEIELKQSYNGDLVYHFKLNDDEYTINFEKGDETVMGKYVDNVWAITFNIDGSFRPTFQNKGMHAVYNKVMLAIKSLLYNYPVNGFIFEGATYAQNLLYHKFYKTFLQKDFIKINYTTYIKKSLIKEISLNASQEVKNNFYKSVINQYRYTLSDKQANKNKKLEQREIYKTLKSNLNKVFKVQFEEMVTSKIILVYKIEGDAMYFFNITTFGIETQKHRIDRLKKIELLPPHTQQYYQQQVLNSEYYKQMNPKPF